MRMGDVPTATGTVSDGTPSWLSQLLQAGTAYLTFEQQRDLIALNTQRAAQNLPPLDISQYSGAGVNVGLASSTETVVKWVAIGGLSVWLLTALISSRSRRR